MSSNKFKESGVVEFKSFFAENANTIWNLFNYGVESIGSLGFREFLTILVDVVRKEVFLI
jgi:hypothetical protein